MFPGFPLALWTLFAPHLDYCCLPGLSLFALPLLDIVRRSSTHACPKDYSVSCPCHTCLLFIDPACIMTMFWNKALHMDPHVSCLVDPVTILKPARGSPLCCHASLVTESPAIPGSSGFFSVSGQPWTQLTSYSTFCKMTCLLRITLITLKLHLIQSCHNSLLKKLLLLGVVPGQGRIKTALHINDLLQGPPSQ